MKYKLLLLLTIITLPSLLCNADREVTIDKDSLQCYVVPPEDLQEENWEFSYSLLKSIKYERSLDWVPDEVPQDTTIIISAVVDNDTIYFRNMVNWSSRSYSRQRDSDNVKVPDAWVRAVIQEDSLIFELRQLSCRFIYDNRFYDAYLTPSYTSYSFDHGSNHTDVDLTSYSKSSVLRLIRKIDQDSQEYWAAPKEPDLYRDQYPGGYGGITVMVDSELQRAVGSHSHTEYSWYPPYEEYITNYFGGKGYGIYANVRLKKVGSGLNSVGQEQQSVSPNFYDMQGRRYNGKPSVPGIYIQNGKKIIIR